MNFCTYVSKQETSPNKLAYWANEDLAEFSSHKVTSNLVSISNSLFFYYSNLLLGLFFDLP